MSPVLKICTRHRTLSSGRCPLCAEDRQARQKIHTHQRGRDFARGVLVRDGYVCHWNFPGCEETAGTVDYIRALANGGEPFDESNAVAACRSCNSKRGARIPNGGNLEGRDALLPPPGMFTTGDMT
jgi:5-methylcytosine-specific restriction endonuclease McrA